MKFMNPEVVFDGIIQIDGSITADNHAVTKSFLNANSICDIHADSSNYAEIVTVSGQKQIKLKPLTIVDVSVDTSAANQAAWLSANYSAGTEFQEGDVIILTGTGSVRPESYIHNGGSAGTAADWTKIEGADVQASEVRGFLSGSSGIDYNSSTGAITADQTEIRAFFSAGTGLTYNAGAFSLNASTDNVSEGSNLYYTDARARSAISVTDSSELDLSYNSGTGALSGALKDGSVGNDRLANSAITIAGASTALGGSITAAAILGASDSDALPEGSSKLFFTDARAQAAISVTDSSEFDLSYSSGAISGALKNGSVANARLANSAITIAGASTSLGGSITAAAILGAGTTANLPENDANKYFTDARARSALSEASGSLCFYDPSSGEIDMPVSNIRKDFASQSLTGGSWATLNHALGKKLVHVSAMDSSGNLVQLEVQYQDTNNVKVKANSNLTCDVAVSL